MIKAQRNVAIDIIRSVACLLVIIIHSAKPSVASPIAAIGTTIVGLPCIGLFFMVSGYLLLPARDALFPFLKKRMKRILFPALFWTLFYLLIAYLTIGIYNHQYWTTIFLSIPFTAQGHGVLWFLYTITGLYILCPILSAWIIKASKREVQFLLTLWIVTLCYPYLKPFVILTENVNGMLYYFSGFSGYFLLGYYIKRFQPNLSKITIISLYAIPIMVGIASKVYHIDFIYHSYSYLSLLVMLMTLSIFVFIIKFTPPMLHTAHRQLSQVIVNFSNCSFGIYLVHIFIMRNILWNINFLNSYGSTFQVVSSVALTTIISWGVVYLISFIPFSEYIIGYRQRKYYDTKDN